jgi:hydrogenase maturation protease
MNRPLLDKIVNAVLYEGYILYPYRRAVKNRQRWTFGSLYPRAYSEAHGSSDAWKMQVECLVRGDAPTTLHVGVRFLHLMDRLIGAVDPPSPDLEEMPMHFVDSLQVGERVFQPWQEALEREAALEPWRLGDGVCRRTFTREGGRRREPIHDAADNLTGVIVREQKAISVSVTLSADRASDELFKVRIQIENSTVLDDAEKCSRDEALLRSLASTSAILEVKDGEFISLIDPPPEARALADSCQNIGAWPVLVGEPGERDAMLAAPIILYDYPQIAPESPGDLFDGTEIDEILSLRIMTLSEDERRQAAGLDERVRALVTRTEALDRRQFSGLHGTMRPLSATQQELTQ